jgi:hypothetical protein
MNVLDLNRVQRPASEFPERAEVYVCDICGRDITKQLPRDHAHASQILGAPFYTCLCGQKYRTGLQEWDSMSPADHWNFLLRAVVPGSLMGLPLIGFIFLVRSTYLHPGYLLLAICVVAAVPSFVFAIFFTIAGLEGMDIFASLWRTRVRGRLQLRQPHP